MEGRKPPRCSMGMGRRPLLGSFTKSEGAEGVVFESSFRWPIRRAAPTCEMEEMLPPIGPISMGGIVAVFIGRVVRLVATADAYFVQESIHQ